MIARLRRVLGFARKEALEAARDPGTPLIAGLMPVLLLLIYGYGISFDPRAIRVGVVVEEPSAETGSFVAALTNSRQFAVAAARDRRAAEADLAAGRVEAVVVLPRGFGPRTAAAAARPGAPPAALQLLVDGTEANAAALARDYIEAAWANWRAQEALARPGAATGTPPLRLAPRFWFNPEVSSHHYLVPGSIALVLTLTGAMLTALVVARERERGTLEALLATPLTPGEFLAGKLLPYFLLGMLAAALAVAVAVGPFGVPFRGSVAALTGVSAVFMLAALGQGLVISVLSGGQLVASQAAILTAFLPSLYFSGFVYETEAMPWPLPLLSYLVPARYYVSSLQTLFLAGDVAAVLVPDMLAMAAIAAALLALARWRLRARVA